jgi:hypothetical protein
MASSRCGSSGGGEPAGFQFGTPLSGPATAGRMRPDGEEIDDVEWTLSVLENAAIPAHKDTGVRRRLSADERRAARSSG